MLLLFVFLFSSTYSLYPMSMIVTYGKPSNYTGYNTHSASTWDDCVVQCYLQPSCVVAASPGTPINCKLYNVNKIFQVDKLVASDDLLVAFKVENSGDTCPVGSNPPTFGDGPSYGSAPNEFANYTYSINPAAGPSWQLNYNVTLVCQNGWTMFTRPTTKWCIQVLGGATLTYTHDQAQAVCQAVGSALTGLETMEERNFIANTAVAMLGPSYPEFAGFWVGGFRRAECYGDHWSSYSYCTGTNPLQFAYDDLYLTNYAGYTWDPLQPDRNSSGGVWQNCIQMWIRNEEKFPQYDYTLKANGNSDDALCDVVDYNGYHLRGFACGKLPQVPVGA